MPDFPAIAQLLPHDDPMVLVDRMTEWSPEGSTCVMTVRANTRFVEGDRLVTPCLLEHMAQTIAAGLGYAALRDGRGPRVGMIISCREFIAHVDATHVSDELVLRAERESGSDSLSRYRCRVERANELIAESTMTLFHGEDLVDSGAPD